ncbi:MAG: hypothetical protein SFY67_04375 [Candidatus Melainabacteria bacterium]|nr:hypothetical protein [Candidatus Melainabacteria bacterium]
MFLSLFHRYGYIYKPYGSSGWLSANEEWKLTDSEILKAAANVHPKYLVGCRSGRASKFAVIDIDAGSKYHNASSLKKICSLLEKAGILETNLYRSSESGGWHLYIFFDAPISSKDLRNQLFQLFRLHEFEIAKGTLEIFPHPGDGREGSRSLGQGLRLPLQRGFAWLNQDTQVVRDERDELSPYEALAMFYQDMTCSVNSYHSFHQLKGYVERLAATKEKIVSSVSSIDKKAADVVPIRRVAEYQCAEDAISAVKSVFCKLPPGIHADIWIRGREYYSVGLTGPSQRADAIYSLSHYLFYGDPQNAIAPMGYGYESERQWVIEEILKTKHHGQSKDIDHGRCDAVLQIERAASWVPAHKRGKDLVKYEAKIPASWAKNNAKRAGLACRKIKAAVEDFQEGNQQFSVRDLAIKSGVSIRTLYKHQELWKKAQDDLLKLQNGLESSRLESVIHEYNAGVGVASSKSNPPDLSVSKDMPPGRLAARRIIYELSMRDRQKKRLEAQADSRVFEASETKWRDRVASLVEINVLEEPLEKVKALVNVLGHMLQTAPCAEDLEWLQLHMRKLKGQMIEREEKLTLKSKSEKLMGDPNSRFKAIKFLSF